MSKAIPGARRRNEIGEPGKKIAWRWSALYIFRGESVNSSKRLCSLRRFLVKTSSEHQDWVLSSSSIARTLVSRDFLVKGLCSKNLSGSVTPARLMRSLAYPDMNRIARCG